ncbi:MAG: helix-turn-helix transcriptional regulator, partial [Chloroflexota bacterium]
MNTKNSGLFPALLKFWRRKRGMSQLDLAVAADVSSRHVSFLETGRAQPSEEMILRLAATLDVPLRNQNEMLRAVNYSERFFAPNLEDEIDPSVSRAIDLMMAQHDPFPIMVMNQWYDILRVNPVTQKLMLAFVEDSTAIKPPLNPFRFVFDPRLARAAVVDWENTARSLLSRLHQEALHHAEKPELRHLVDEMLAFPDVPEEWRQPDFGIPDTAAYTIRFRNNELELAFLTTVTTFSTANNITLEELRIESYFPLD